MTQMMILKKSDQEIFHFIQSMRIDQHLNQLNQKVFKFQEAMVKILREHIIDQLKVTII